MSARLLFPKAGRLSVLPTSLPTASSGTTHPKNGAVTVSSFGGRLRVVFRPRSSSDGSPVVEIYSQNLPGKHPAYQKIHFTRRNP